jgi:competence protein ComEC
MSKAARAWHARLQAMLARPAPLGHDSPARGVPTPTPVWRVGWALAGGVAGTALQLQQAQLWPVALYLSLLATGVLGLGIRSRLAWALAAAALAFGATGGRALLFQATQLDPALEGRNLVAVGRVASLPQTGATGLRFEFVIEQATADGAPVRLPARVLLGWFQAPGEGAAAPPPPSLVAGDRWAFELRLKRPHGSLNPHGFDRERWLWERGIGATGHVRQTVRGAPPRHLGSTAWHPVDRARQALVRAIDARVSDPRAAGVIAALVVGDQSAIVGSGKRVVRSTLLANQRLNPVRRIGRNKRVVRLAVRWRGRH